ncbi:Capsular polysaccharide biosynthesis protein [Caloramator quimbayensis]|uniref:Capsular polysaccharide biosynthesis protein n=1 Tax=Caloramator quimbayensis TaxID=1147123 RepID=A0A1T4XWJ3_9CLOT|nr:Wzz/FepE/Etk N-terminal domain-containing protein [Caloramator quimbayensis]SKA93907.1 Capsular polysaccharide biosynthesis protein [Caloramator quimbayensis]
MSEEDVLDLRDIIKILKKGKWIIVYITALTVTIASIISLFFIKPKYESKVSVVIVKEAARMFYEDRYTQSDILMYQKLLKTYCEIAKSSAVVDKTAQEYPQYKSEDIKKMVSAVPLVDTQIIELKVKCDNPYHAQNIVNSYAENFIEESMRVLPAGDIQILDRGKYVDSPISPNYKLNLSIAFVLGIMLSIGLIFLLEYIDTKIRTKEQIEKNINLPVLSEITPSKGLSLLSQSNCGNFKDSFFELECFKLLKNSLLLSKDTKEKKSFLITSINEGEGKTTVAANLAINLSRDSKKTLLMDLNPITNNLIKIIEGEDIFKETEFKNLYVFSPHFLKSDNYENINLEEIFKSAHKNFDYIIADMPSCEHLSFIQDVSRFTDGCIFVIKVGLVDIKEFINTKEILERTDVKIIGTIINKDINIENTKDSKVKSKKIKLFTRIERRNADA